LEEFKEPEVNEYGPRDSSLKPTTGCDKESDNSKENTDDSLEQHQMTDTETSSFESPLKVDKDWKEKFFYPANHVESVNQIEKPVKRTVRYAEMYNSDEIKKNSSNNSKENSDKSLVEEQVSQVKSSSVEGCESNTSKSVSELEPKKVKKNNDALIIEDWVSDDEEQDESMTKPENKMVIPTVAKIEKPVKKLVRQNRTSVNAVRPRIVNTARSYKTHVNPVRPRVINTARKNRTSVNAARANKFNAVKPSACWVWRPIKPNSASITLNRYNF
ncbi:hypothetical protein Tco_1275279, partial [Tanacetum coccineum]